MNFYHFRPSCKVLKRSRTTKGPFLPNYEEEIIEEICRNEDLYVHEGKLTMNDFGLHFHFSRKVFIGGLPLDITENDVLNTFDRFGPLMVDWPYKEDTNSVIPPKGFAFLLYKNNFAVDCLVKICENKDDGYFYSISSKQIKDKVIQIRPWRISGIDHTFVPLQEVNQRFTVFVGGVPRTLDAEHLGKLMARLFGKVTYVGIDTDAEYLYPKGSARVIFDSQSSVIAAVKKRFVMPLESSSRKMIEIKPYVLDRQQCDNCNSNCHEKLVLFCPETECLLYLCEFCWIDVHSTSNVLGNHKPVVKQGLDDYMNSLKKRGLEYKDKDIRRLTKSA